MSVNGIALNAGVSPPRTCRVTMDFPIRQACPGRASMGAGEYITPPGVRYQTGGMSITNFNVGLRLPQRRTFLGPEYFNGGCVPENCKDAKQCPAGRRSTSTKATNQMFEAAFGSPMEFTGNDAPPQCFGGVCSSYNSTLGWEATPTGQLAWQTNQPGVSCS